MNCSKTLFFRVPVVRRMVLVVEGEDDDDDVEEEDTEAVDDRSMVGVAVASAAVVDLLTRFVTLLRVCRSVAAMEAGLREAIS